MKYWLDQSPDVINVKFTGSWLCPELYPRFPPKASVGICDNWYCLKVSSANLACTSACLMDILLLTAYSTQRFRSHLSCAEIERTNKQLISKKESFFMVNAQIYKLVCNHHRFYDNRFW